MSRHLIDISDQRFGKLVAIREVERDKHKQRRWLCKCDCGNTKVIRMHYLRSGETKSCGCLPRPKMDLTGKVFGRLTVIKEDKPKGDNRMFLCQCSCGNKTSVYMNSLRNGTTKSCGCLRDERASETRKKDLTNQMFGKLTAIKIARTHTTKQLYVWLCKCDFGNEVEVRSDNLSSGETKSCGCLKKKQDRENPYLRKEEMRVDGVAVTSLTRKLQSNNTSGHKGVYWSKRDKRWIVRIGLKGKSIHIGTFKEKIDAIQARKKAEELIHLPYIEALEEMLKIKNK